ncbi:MAG: hypothetical protein IKY34_06595 [Ruminiclostridium sp.]|nr:hypothetical protein [Ruminiclostridium sp.]
MKKLIAILLSLTFVLSVSVCAGTIMPGYSEQKTVTATYRATDAPVYSVDITWGSMVFVYAKKSAGLWDPETHTYSNAVTEGWQYPVDSTSGLAANEIKITNHSNAEIGYTVTFAPSSTLTRSDTSYTLEKDTDTIATAVGTSIDNAPYKIARLVLNGETPSESFDVGTLNVTISTQ